MKPIPFLLLALACTAARAQDAPRDPEPLPDIEFAADVHMDAIRFDGAPRAHVDFSGGPRLDHRHDVERDGLPRPVIPGTYRDVTVRTTISATLLDPLDAPAADAPPASSPNEDSP